MNSPRDGDSRASKNQNLNKGIDEVSAENGQPQRHLNHPVTYIGHLGAAFDSEREMFRSLHDVTLQELPSYIPSSLGQSSFEEQETSVVENKRESIRLTNFNHEKAKWEK